MVMEWIGIVESSTTRPLKKLRSDEVNPHTFRVHELFCENEQNANQITRLCQETDKTDNLIAHIHPTYTPTH